MKCITESQIDDWLDQRSIHKDPYHGNASPAFYLQFNALTNHRRIDAFVRHYYDRIAPEVDSLIHKTDWGLCQQSEMIAIVGIRSSRGEDRMLIDAPGHILPSGEKEIGISLFGLSASFAWSSYLYSPRDHSILFNWEGEIFDFWTDSEQAVSEMRLMLNQFDLTETNKENKPRLPTGHKISFAISIQTHANRVPWSARTFVRNIKDATTRIQTGVIRRTLGHLRVFPGSIVGRFSLHALIRHRRCDIHPV